jgi:hypothetical protein
MGRFFIFVENLWNTCGRNHCPVKKSVGIDSQARQLTDYSEGVDLPSVALCELWR